MIPILQMSFRFRKRNPETYYELISWPRFAENRICDLLRTHIDISSLLVLHIMASWSLLLLDQSTPTATPKYPPTYCRLVQWPLAFEKKTQLLRQLRSFRRASVTTSSPKTAVWLYRWFPKSRPGTTDDNLAHCLVSLIGAIKLQGYRIESDCVGRRVDRPGKKRDYLGVLGWWRWVLVRQ